MFLKKKEIGIIVVDIAKVAVSWYNMPKLSRKIENLYTIPLFFCNLCHNFYNVRNGFCRLIYLGGVSMKKELRTNFSTRQYMLSKDFEIYYYNDRNLPTLRDHTHNYYEFYFLLGGDVSIFIDGVSFPLKQ